MGEIENFEEILKELEKMKTMSKYLKDCGQDFINIAKDIDNFIDLLTNPFRIMMSNDISADMNKITIEVQLKTILVSSKLNALSEYMGNKKRR